MVGREVPVLRPEIPLQFNGIARRQRHYRLQPECRRLRDMRATDLAFGPSDFGRSVQHARACSRITAYSLIISTTADPSGSIANSSAARA